MSQIRKDDARATLAGCLIICRLFVCLGIIQIQVNACSEAQMKLQASKCFLKKYGKRILVYEAARGERSLKEGFREPHEAAETLQGSEQSLDLGVRPKCFLRPESQIPAEWP